MLDSSHTHLSISLELDSSHGPESSLIQAKLLLFCKYPFNPPQTSTLIITFRSTKTERKHFQVVVTSLSLRVRKNQQIGACKKIPTRQKHTQRDRARE
jgi:hypothetical protein